MRLNINTKAIALAGMLIAALNVNAQVISLDSVLKAIEAKNPMLQEYNQRIEAYSAYTEGATSWMAPMVGFGPYWYPYPGQEVEDRDKGFLMATLDQDIPNPSKLKANKNFLASRANVEKEGRLNQYNKLRAEAKTYYYAWLVSEEKLKVLDENEKIIELMLKLANIRYPYNQGSLGSIYKTEGRLYEVQNMKLMTKGDIEELSYRLKSLMNLPHSANIMVDTTYKVKYEPDLMIQDTTALTALRSDVRQIDKTIETMRLNKQLQSFQAKPDFRVRLEHMQPLGDMPKQFTAMAMVSIPIAPWSSKMYKAEVKGLEFEIEAMKKSKEAILLEAQGMLSGMAAQLQRTQQQLENYRLKIIPSLRKNYETIMLAYEENREQLPVVIDGWEAMNMAQLEYLGKLSDYYNMIAAYEKELEK